METAHNARTVEDCAAAVPQLNMLVLMAWTARTGDVQLAVHKVQGGA